MEDKNEGFESFGAKLVDQDELEQDITKKANEVLINKDAELEKKRLESTSKNLNNTISKIRNLQKRLDNPKTKLSQRKSLRDEIKWYEENELLPLKKDIEEITGRLEENKSMLAQSKENDGPNDTLRSEMLPGESEKDFLIRTGKITAFGTETAFSQDNATIEKKSHTELREPGFLGSKEPTSESYPDAITEDVHDEDYNDENLSANDDEDGYYTSDNDNEPPSKRFKVEEEHEHESEDLVYNNSFEQQKSGDDGDESIYQERLNEWIKKRSSLRKDNNIDDDTPEWLKTHPSIADAKLDSRFKLPGDIYPSLFDYQKTCVQWLWELYQQKTGGIIGDEMGLGKTVQIISFIAGLHYSGLLEKPILVVVPATVLNQWVNEFHRWWPPLRCIILHSIGSGMTNVSSEEKLEAFLETNDPDESKRSVKNLNSQINANEIVNTIMEKGHVLITTYVGLRMYSKFILDKEWGYCILDEGHKVRNPNSDISLTCKQIKTYNRIILSGTPIQNNLIELWSLFDFVFPGRLGTLPIFEQQFAIPINMGGYANASNVQVQTGYKCAVILRDLISPYLLRRLKKDVAKDLPKKNEMVLFVKLTKVQQELYEKFLQSEDLNSIMKGKRNVLMGVDTLRKICNHPDLIFRDKLMHRPNYGNPKKSGKMQVLKSLIQLWQAQKHRTLLFCQTKQMLDILEKFIGNLKTLDAEGKETDDARFFMYLRMDGSTPIARRQALIDRFNNDASIDVFLLTTKVGGLGINLTGADRVIIYDPDWNPSTDIQARERAWRLGQKKDITIYRLMTTGSIEEKIYHRQVFKTFLTNKILKDPKQRRFFKVNDLHDLFTLGDQDEVGTETGDLFNGSETYFRGNKPRKHSKLMTKKHDNDDDFYEVAKISGISKLNEYEEGNENSNDNSKSSIDENRIMEGIFSQTGVHSTLKHDDIVDSSNQEVSLVEKEARKVANNAANALKRSRKLARKTEIGVPTWTGKFGLAGKFGPKKKKQVATSSTSILQNIKEKSGASVPDVVDPSPDQSPPVTDKDSIMKKIVDFLSSSPYYSRQSDDILKHLELTKVNDTDVVLIRSMLREVANWKSDQKQWTLKEEFR